METMIGAGTSFGFDLSAIRRRLGLTQAEFAKLVGLSERSIAGSATGAELNANSQRRIIEADRLATELEGVFRNVSGISKWLSSANPGFEQLTPLAVIERGEIDRVWRALYFLQSGSPN